MVEVIHEILQDTVMIRVHMKFALEILKHILRGSRFEVELEVVAIVPYHF